MDHAVKATPALSSTALYGRLDRKEIRRWLSENRSPETLRVYKREIIRFRRFIRKPLHAVRRTDMERFRQSLACEPATARRILAIVRSLFGSACRSGYLVSNPAAVIDVPRPPARNIEAHDLDEAETLRLISRTTDAHERAILRLLYAGVRPSEIRTLRWRHLHGTGKHAPKLLVVAIWPRKDQLMRWVSIKTSLYHDILRLRGDADEDTTIFDVSERTVHRMVTAAAERAAIPARIRPRDLRMAGAVHAMRRGAPERAVCNNLGITSLDRYWLSRSSDDLRTAPYLRDL